MSNIGRVIYGFCNGLFGRDSYYDKRIESEGVDWVIARRIDKEDALPEFACFNGWNKQKLIDEWSIKEKESE